MRPLPPFAMCTLHLVALLSLLSLLCTGCATRPAREPVTPEPRDNVLQSAGCADRGSPDLGALGKLKFDPRPYGWAIARLDVEHGIVVKVEILDSSPKERFDAQTIALLMGIRYPSLATARGCIWRHRWD